MVEVFLKIINDKTREWTVIYSLGGEKCKTKELDLTDKIVNQYASYGCIRDDIELLLQWARELKIYVSEFENMQENKYEEKEIRVIEKMSNDQRSKIYQIFTSIVITYGRLFSGTKSRITLSDKYVKPKYKEIHDSLSEARNYYIAHVSDKKYEDKKVFLVFHPNDESQFMITYYSMKVYFPQSESAKEYVDYFEDLLEQIREKINELRSVIDKEYLAGNIKFK